MTDAILELTKITQAVAMADSPLDQVRIIVDEISQFLSMDVCSLYRMNEARDMVLLATHGLQKNRPVKIPAGKGLVGLVVENRHTINLANSLNHPAYFHVEDIKEELFKSFCGAPMVANGEVIGVLVVQGRKAKKLSEKQEAFLATMASHIALIVQQLPKQLSRPRTDYVVSGIAASEGLGIGRAVRVNSAGLKDVSIAYNTDPEQEKVRWVKLLEEVLAHFESEKQALELHSSDEISSMFDAYKMLLLDQTLSLRVEELITEGFAIQYAIKQAIQHFAELFQKMDDQYLKERGVDVWHIGNKLYQTLQGQNKDELSDDQDMILVGEDVSVSDIAACKQERLKAIVCATGSRLSHTSILANALGIPAVMGIDKIIDREDLEVLVVDGFEGKVYLNPKQHILSEFKAQIERQDELKKELDNYRSLPSVTHDGTPVALYANSGLMADITPGIRHGAEGIGLFRTEIPFILSESFPTEEEQCAIYKNVFERYENKPVYMRTLDIGGDKQLPYFPIGWEENPAMGWRGIRFTLDNIQLLMTQVRAMIRAAGPAGELNILLPMVSSLEELDAFRQVLNDALDQLQSEGFEIKRPKLGVMIEIPAAISQIKFWANDIDFISVGTNDLCQYLMAVDRNNTKVSKRIDHVHPALINEMHRIMGEANRHQLPVCVCGEMASEPVAVLLLIGLGVRRLSVSSARIPKLKAMIRQLEISDAEKFAQEAMGQRYASTIRGLGEALLEKLNAQLS